MGHIFFGGRVSLAKLLIVAAGLLLAAIVVSPTAAFAVSLTLTKTAQVSETDATPVTTATPGQSFTYKISVDAVGVSNNVVVDDIMPAGVTLWAITYGAWSCGSSTTTAAHCSLSNIGNTTSFFFVDVTVGSGVNNTILTNTATVTSTEQPGGVTGSASVTVGTPPPPPVVTGISPSAGSRDGGTRITITGSHFTGATSVKIDGTSRGFTFVNDTTITLVTPAHAVGTVDVTVTTPNGTSAITTDDQFTFVGGILTLSVTGSPNPVAAGATLTYTIHYSNRGLAVVTDPSITLPLDPRVTFTSIDAAGWDCPAPPGGSGGDVLCTKPSHSLGPNETGFITLVVQVAGGTADGTVLSLDAALGSSSDSAATDTASVTVDTPVSSTTSVTSSVNPSTVGQSVTFTATVTGGATTPTGTVTFKDGNTLLGTGTLDGSGKAPFTTSSLALGPHTITATYSGDNTHLTSSQQITQQVNVAGSLSLTMTVSPSHFVTAGETVQVIYTVTNTGTVTVTDIAVSDTSVPSIVCSATSLAAGASTTCTGLYVVTSADMTTGTHGFSASVTSQGQVMATTTASIASGVTAVQQQFETMTDQFIRDRNALLSSGITTPDLDDRGGPGVVNLSGDDGNPVLNFAASSLGPGADAADRLAEGTPDQKFAFWVDGNMAFHWHGDTTGEFGLVGVGADFKPSKDFLAGVALYVDWMRDVSDAGNVHGTGVLVGPYMSVRLTDGVILDANLFYGRSWNNAEANVLGQDFSGDFGTERWLGNLKLKGEWLVDEVTLHPDATLFLAHESAGDYIVTDSMGDPVTVPGTTLDELRLSVGLEAERTFVLDDGLKLTPMLGGRAGVSNPSWGDPFTDLFGSVSGGVSLASEWWTLKGTVEGDFEQSGLSAVGATGSLSGRF